MQSLPKHFIPIAIIALLTVAGCSSQSSTSHKPAGLNNDSSASSGLDLSSIINVESPTLNAADVNAGDSLSRDGFADADSTTTNTVPGVAEPMLNSSNYENVTQSVVQALNMHELEFERVNAHAILSQLNEAGWGVVSGETGLPGLTLVSQENVPSEFGRGDYAQIYTCDEGGLLTLILRDFNGAPISHHSATFDHCSLSGDMHNGDLESTGGRRAPRVTTFTNYSRKSTNQTISLTGEHEHYYAMYGMPESNEWTNTEFEITNSMGTLKAENVSWREQGADAPNSDRTYGFVQLPDGTAGYVARFNQFADLEASFNFTSAQFQHIALTVDVNLGFYSHYFDWQGHPQTGFDLPAFPVSELGVTIDLHSEHDFSGASRTVDLLPKNTSPQWQAGEIRILASDSSSVTMKPDINNAKEVLIELNGSGEYFNKQWAEGYQVTCPSSIGVCGGSE